MGMTNSSVIFKSLENLAFPRLRMQLPLQLPLFLVVMSVLNQYREDVMSNGVGCVRSSLLEAEDVVTASV